MSAGLPQKYKDTKVEDVQSLLVFPTEGESTQTEYRLCGSFALLIITPKLAQPRIKVIALMLCYMLLFLSVGKIFFKISLYIYCIYKLYMYICISNVAKGFNFF